MRDRKFGHHWIWLLPMYWCMTFGYWLIKVAAQMILSMRTKYLEYKNPELKRIRKLSGNYQE